jgi:hypothetical protein
VIAGSALVPLLVNESTKTPALPGPETEPAAAFPDSLTPKS